MGGDYEILGGGSIIRGRFVFMWNIGGYLSSFEEFGFGVLVNHCKGHRVARGFGLEG